MSKILTLDIVHKLLTSTVWMEDGVQLRFASLLNLMRILSCSISVQGSEPY